MLFFLSHQLQPARLGMGRDQFDAHLHGTIAHLPDPAHYGDAPGLIVSIANADHFPGLQLLRYLFRPAEAVTSRAVRSEEHTSELQSLMRISYAVFCLKQK